MSHHDAVVMFVKRKRHGYIEDGDGADEIPVRASHLTDANSQNMAVGISMAIGNSPDTGSGSSKDIRVCAAAPDSPLATHRGTLVNFLRGKNYGFIEDADGSGDVFIHGSQLKRLRGDGPGIQGDVQRRL